LALVTAAALVLIAVVAIFMLSTPEPPPGADKTRTAVREVEKDREAKAEKAEHLPRAPARDLAKKGAPGLEGEEERFKQPQVAQVEPAGDRDKLAGIGARHAKLDRKLYLEEEIERPTASGTVDAQRMLKKQKPAGVLAERLEKAQPSANGKAPGLADQAARPELDRVAPPAGEPEYGNAKDNMARAQNALGAGKLRDKELGHAAPKGEGEPQADGGQAGARTEEYVLKTGDVSGTAEAVGKLLAAYTAQGRAQDKAVSRGGEGAGAKEEEADKEDDEEALVLLVQVDSRQYRELIKKLEALKEPAALKGGKKKEHAERKATGEETGEESAWTGRERKEQPDAPGAKRALAPGRTARRSGGRGGGKAPEPEKPLSKPSDKSFAEEVEKRKKAKEEKKESEKTKPQAESIEKPAEGATAAPKKKETAKPGGPGKAAGEMITLRIVIVRKTLSSSKLLEILRKSAEPKPASNEGK
jgi:hypothetical protein